MQWETKLGRAYRDLRFHLVPYAYNARKKLLHTRAWRPTEKPRQPLVLISCRESRVDGVSGRRLHHLVSLFEAAGCAVVIHATIPMCGNFYSQKFKIALLQHPITFVKSPAVIDQDYIMVSDRPCPTAMPPHCVKWIVLKYAGGWNADTDVALPFPLFPNMYDNGDAAKLKNLRGTKNGGGVLFAGCTRSGYDRAAMMRIYGKTARKHAIKAMFASLSPHLLTTVRHADDIASPCAGMIYCAEKCYYGIPEHEWMSTIARFDFFLCLAGTRYPMCHNAVESLALGVIPILDYPEHFYPPLQNGVNCLVYQNIDDLTNILHRALTMTNEEKIRLAKGAEDYYDAHMQLEKIGQNLLSDPRKTFHLHLTYHAISHKEK